MEDQLNYTKESLKAIFKAISTLNKVELNPDHFTISEPLPSDMSGFTAMVLLKAKVDSPYVGERKIYYNKMNLSALSNTKESSYEWHSGNLGIDQRKAIDIVNDINGSRLDPAYVKDNNGNYIFANFSNDIYYYQNSSDWVSFITPITWENGYIKDIYQSFTLKANHDSYAWTGETKIFFHVKNQNLNMEDVPWLYPHGDLSWPVLFKTDYLNLNLPNFNSLYNPPQL